MMAEYKDIEPLLKHIKDIKKRMLCEQDSGYITGYICALSVVEGIIAGLSTERVIHMDEVAHIFDEIHKMCAIHHKADGQAMTARIDLEKFRELEKKYKAIYEREMV
jgi:hypothetical protein